MRRIFSHILLLVFVLSFAMISSCKKDSFITDSSAVLEFDIDTLSFDTVFTTLGSATRSFRVFNTYNERLRISSVRLAGGANSSFRFNVDADTGLIVSDVEIWAKDSAWVFVEVTVDPNALNQPFVIYDELIFETNGNEQRIVLEAWGQNAHFYKGQVICDTTWTNDKPYVIQNSLLVDSFCTLTIKEGCRIYASPNSRLFVSGTLRIEGTQSAPVTFEGVRLEPFFDDLPGQWQGIHILRGSTDNYIEYADLSEGVVGVRVDSLPVNANPGLTIKNTIIRNTLSSGILGLTAVIDGENLLIHSSGDYATQLELGGVYRFQQSTFANYGSIVVQHQKPIVRMSNYLEVNSNLVLAAPLNAEFNNCIVYGSLEDELQLDSLEGQGVAFDFLFDHCLIRAEDTLQGPTYINCISNEDPLFESFGDEDFHLTTNSPAIDAGKAGLGITNDLDGTVRDAMPDLGCYEFAQ